MQRWVTEEELQSLYSPVRKKEDGGVADMDGDIDNLKSGGHWIQQATAHMRTDHPCTGSKFGGPSCPPGSKRYNLAKTFRHMNHKQQGGMFDELLDITNGVTNYFDNINQQKATNAYLKNQTSTDGLYGPQAQGVGHGDYVNTGSAYGQFRPTKSNPYSPQGMQGMYYPTAQNGLEMDQFALPTTDQFLEPPIDIPTYSHYTGYVPPQQGHPQAPQQPMQRTGDIATTTNNPGNMKFHPWMKRFGAVSSGIPGKDGGVFAAFPDLNAGLQAYQTQLFGDTDGILQSKYYKANTPVDQALRTWSNGSYGVNIFPELKGRKLGELSPAERKELARRQIQRESGQMYKQLQSHGIFKQGGEYSVDESEIERLKALGYEFEYL